MAYPRPTRNCDMSVIGEFSVPAGSFVLDDALRTVPGMTIEAGQLATHSSMEVLPFLWVTGCDFERAHRALDDDPHVTDRTVAEETDDAVLYRLGWVEPVRDLINEMVDHHAAVVEATAREREWHLTLRFSKERHVSAFQRHFRDTEREFEVHHLGRPEEPRQRTFGLTPEQHEALVLALDEGYFDVPRATSVETLGEKLDISANSVSQRLRRGNAALVRNALTVTDDD